MRLVNSLSVRDLGMIPSIMDTRLNVETVAIRLRSKELFPQTCSITTKLLTKNPKNLDNILSFFRDINSVIKICKVFER